MFFFVQVLFPEEGEVAKGTTNYRTLDEAEQAFHTAIASAISKPEYHKAIGIVFGDDGIVRMHRVWERSVDSN